MRVQLSRSIEGISLNSLLLNVYDDLRDKLIARGIPAEEIAYIHTANTEVQKKELFGKVRSGQVRVLIGSTQTGANRHLQGVFSLGPVGWGSWRTLLLWLMLSHIGTDVLDVSYILKSYFFKNVLASSILYNCISIYCDHSQNIKSVLQN